MSEPLVKAWRRLRSGGPVALFGAGLRFLDHHYRDWLDGRVDRRFGIDTRGVQDDLAGLGASGEHVAHAYGYEPIQIPIFHMIVRALPINPRDYDFIDYGAGKGRALVLAAEAGFRRMTGIEFAPALYAAAQENIARYRSVRAAAPPIELSCADASEYVLPARNAVLFLYNPFDAYVMRKVLARIESGWREHGCDWIVAYRNPDSAELLESRPFLYRIAKHRAFRIYRTRRDQLDLPNR